MPYPHACTCSSVPFPCPGAPCRFLSLYIDLPRTDIPAVSYFRSRTGGGRAGTRVFSAISIWRSQLADQRELYTILSRPEVFRELNWGDVPRAQTYRFESRDLGQFRRTGILSRHYRLHDFCCAKSPAKRRLRKAARITWPRDASEYYYTETSR